MYKLIHLFLLTLFLSYYGSITFFSHYHVINGVTIVHSHMFCGQPESDGSAGHSHTTKEITLIAQLSTFVTLIMAAIAIIAPYSVLRKHYYIRKQAEEPDKQIFSLSLLRAPPIFA